MIRNLKYLGLALVAALAMSSVAASVASADILTAEAAETSLSGKQGATPDVFKVDGGEVKCSTVTYTGTTGTASSAITAVPTYAGCTFAGLAATIHMNGCTYLVTPNVVEKSTEGAIDIVCPAGKEITVTAPSVGTLKCVVHVPGQAGLKHVKASVVGSGETREITLEINITDIKYSQTAGTAETGNCATADNTTGGTYKGHATITGFKGSTHIGLFLSA